MTKQINIEGMSCSHCVQHVKDALLEIENVVDVAVSLEEKNAVIQISDSNDISDDILKEAIEEAGYDVISIVNK